MITTDESRSKKPVQITVKDLETGNTELRELTSGDYALIVTEPLYLDCTYRYSNGTVTLTLKRRKPTETGASIL